MDNSGHEALARSKRKLPPGELNINLDTNRQKIRLYRGGKERQRCGTLIDLPVNLKNDGFFKLEPATTQCKSNA